MDFNAVFTVRFKNERHMRWYELHAPHLINVATLPCETQNTENVIYSGILTKRIASDVSQLHKSGPGSSYVLSFLIWGVIQQSLHETKIHDIDDLRKLTGTSSMLALPSEIMCACWWWTLWTHTQLYDSPEHFTKLQLDACNDYFVVNITSLSCVHVHFRCFDFRKLV